MNYKVVMSTRPSLNFFSTLLDDDACQIKREQHLTHFYSINVQYLPLMAIVRMLFFHPRDAMLARVLAMALCLCLSQVGVLLKWFDGSSWFLAWRPVSTSPTVCFKEIQVSTTNKDTSLRNFFLSSGLIENLAMAYRSSRKMGVVGRLC